MKNLLLALALLSGLAACAAAPLTPDELSRNQLVAATLQPPATEVQAFTVENRRAPEATEVRLVPIGWAGGFSCFVGIVQLGDAQFAADRIIRLENALAAAFPGRRSDLIVRRYDIYLNRGAEADAATMGAAMGSVGVFGAGGTPGNDAPQLWRSPKCGRDRMHSGWFDRADLTNNNPPITIDIDISVFGRDYAINAARSPELPLERLGVVGLQDSPAFQAMVQQAMTFANERLVTAVEQDPLTAGDAPAATPSP